MCFAVSVTSATKLKYQKINRYADSRKKLLYIFFYCDFNRIFTLVNVLSVEPLLLQPTEFSATGGKTKLRKKTKTMESDSVIEMKFREVFKGMK